MRRSGVGTVCGALAALALPVAPGAAGTGTFTPVLPAPAVQSGPTYAALADANGDGALDIATVGLGGGGAVLLGDGTGRMALAPPLPAVPAATGLAVGDIDGDGDQDLAAGLAFSASVAVLLNDGTARFTAGPPIALPAGPRSVAIADLNGDGVQDLVATLASPARVTVRLGTGGGGFAAAMTTDSGAAGDLAVGDVNEDGLLDVVVANGDFASADALASVIGPGGAHSLVSLPGWVAENGVTTVALGDADGDGHLDALLTSVGAATVWLSRGDGAGRFTEVFPRSGTGPSPYGPAVADLDGDGRADAATVSPSDDSVSAFLGGPGGLGARVSRTPTGDFPIDVAAGDLDRDGNADLIAVNATAATVSVLRGEGPSPAAGNLLADPGADVPGAAGTPAAAPAVPGWTRVGGEPTYVRYSATGGFPSLIDAARWNGGANFFTGGIGPAAEAQQTIPLGARAAAIDAGRASAQLSGLLGGYGTDGDAVTVTAAFLDAGGAAIGAPLAIGPVTPADRRNQTVLLRRTATGPVPPGARAVRVAMRFTRASGTYDDGYADDLLLRVGTAAELPPPPGVVPRCAGRRATIVARGRVTRGTPRADVIVGRPGRDVIRAGAGADLVCGGGGDDLLAGGRGNDRLLGGAGRDRLLGQIGRDVLTGGAGRDVLIGGVGRDRLAGGPGRDRQVQQLRPGSGTSAAP